MAARLLLRNCVLAEDFQIREDGGETFLALKNPPPVGSVVTVVEDEGEGRSFRVCRVVEVAESPDGIGCAGSFVDEPAPTTVGSENIAPDPEAVRAVVARDPSLASRYSQDETPAGEPAQAEAADAEAQEPDAGEQPAGGEEAASAGPAGDGEAGGQAAETESGDQGDGDQGDGGTKKSKKKGKKRKGRKRG